MSDDAGCFKLRAYLKNVTDKSDISLVKSGLCYTSESVYFRTSFMFSRYQSSNDNKAYADCLSGHPSTTVIR